jgi:hypothetical protein
MYGKIWPKTKRSTIECLIPFASFGTIIRVVHFLSHPVQQFLFLLPLKFPLSNGSV